MAIIPDPPPAAKKPRIERQAASQPLYDSATRQARRSTEEATAAAGPTRRLEVSTMFDHYLSGCHFKQIALVAGTAGQCLQKNAGQWQRIGSRGEIHSQRAGTSGDKSRSRSLPGTGTIRLSSLHPVLDDVGP